MSLLTVGRYDRNADRLTLCTAAKPPAGRQRWVIVCAAALLLVVPAPAALTAASVASDHPPASVRPLPGHSAAGQASAVDHPGGLEDGAPPLMPVVFDRETVERLIGALEREHNASILKVGYFLRHSPGGLPKKDGMALLYNAVGKERAGSRRWYLLKSVAAFGALHAGGHFRDDAWEIYTELFHASFLPPEPGTSDIRAGLVGAEDIVARAVDEYVSASPATSGIEGATGAEKPTMTLLAGLAAYMELLRYAKEPEYLPPWRRTMVAVADPYDLKKLITDDLEDFSFPRTYTVFKTAAEICEQSDPEAALTYLHQAERHLQTSNPRAVGDYYEQLVSILIRLKRPLEAIRAQKERIRLTGLGRASLALLYLQTKDEAGYESVLDELERSNARDQDIVDLAAAITRPLSHDAPSRGKHVTQGVELLERYLDGKRFREVEQDQRARLLLVRLLVWEGKTQEAKVVLDAAPSVPSEAAPLARMEARAIERMKQRLGAGRGAQFEEREGSIPQ